MVTHFRALGRVESLRTKGFILASILVLFSFAVAAQTAPKTSPKTAKAPAKKSPGPAAHPTAIIHTTQGDMKCELFPDKSPHAVANFIGLSRGTKAWNNPLTGKKMQGKPLYDGVIFHRTLPDFMIQSGDPGAGTGPDDVGFEISDALAPDLLFDQPGRLAMANRGGNPATSASQFFITEKELPFLNPCLDEGGCPQLRRQKGTGYIIFGQCDSDTVALAKKIASMPCTAGPVCSESATAKNSRPVNPVKITHIDIQGAGSSAKPAAKKTAPKTKTAPK